MDTDYKLKEPLKLSTVRTLAAKHYYSGFELAHDTYNALSPASDGKIYYVLSSNSIDKGGQMFLHDPVTDSIKFLGDLTDICGEKGKRAIPQGKSHVDFMERGGKLFFGPHGGVYEMVDGMERLPKNPRDNYAVYRGGHIISYDLASGKFEDLAIDPNGEGILTMAMDAHRGQIYGITWPYGNFFHYDIDANKLLNLGLISRNGEAGVPGQDYRVLCRSMFVDPKTALVYYSTAEGDIYFYDANIKAIQKLEGVNLRLDYFGQYDTTSPGSMAYNWRKILWHPAEEVAYGVHGNSGYLFRFDPRRRTVEIIERITSEPSRRSGMFDQFSYGYLGFTLGPDNETIYYLTGGPVYVNGQRVNGETKIAKGAARGIENLHLITYHLPTRRYRDHGAIFYPDGTRPTYVNSIAVSDAGEVYMLARYEHEGRVIQDLVKIQSQLQF